MMAWKSIKRPNEGAWRRLLASILAVVLIMGLLPAIALAEAEEDVPTQSELDADMIDQIKLMVDLEPISPSGETANIWDNYSDEIKADWLGYLRERFYSTTGLDEDEAALSWNTDNRVENKWSGEAASEEDENLPDFDADTETYTVSNGEELLYALQQCADHTGYTIDIVEDIDLNGQSGADCNWPGVNLENATTINGNGHTIYNLRVNHALHIDDNDKYTFAYASFLGLTRDLTMSKLNFDHVNIVGTENQAVYYSDFKHATGIIGYCTTTNDGETSLTDIQVTDSLFVGRDHVGAIFGRMGSPGKTAKYISRCSAEGIVSFGCNHVGTLAGSVVYADTIDHCYSVGGTSISLGCHSGGLFSCLDTVNKVDSCFVDAEVYGFDRTGVFVGVTGGKLVFTKCFASGFIEGMQKLGGFIGEAAYASGGTYTFNDCYSTALVGLRSNGSRLGGFIGSCYEYKGMVLYMTNCYAAGEVGSVDTDASGGATGDTRSDYIGGMVGCTRIHENKDAFVNCYYDKQTTAMREWGIGNANQHEVFSGLKGVLTTNSAKAGNGLTSTFEDEDITGGFAKFPEGDTSVWDYSAANHYPELVAFKNADETDWGSEHAADTARAYSYSSTSGVQLNTWDIGVNTGTGLYDTESMRRRKTSTARFAT